MHRLRHHRHCCQGVVISVVLALCLCLSVFRTYENTSSLPSLGQEYSRRSLVIPLMGTQHINASRATILNCSQIPKNNDDEQWKVYAESVLKAREAEQRELEDKRKGANKNTSPLHECSVCLCVYVCVCDQRLYTYQDSPLNVNFLFWPRRQRLQQPAGNRNYARSHTSSITHTF